MREIPAGADGVPASQLGKHQPLEFEKPLFKLEQQLHELEALQSAKQVDYTKELRQLRTNYTSLLRKTYDKLSAWETVQVARHPQRPQLRDYCDMICREFRELHGDRNFGDDHAIQCGLAGRRACSARTSWRAPGSRRSSSTAASRCRRAAATSRA
jgi:hypothetical protein